MIQMLFLFVSSYFPKISLSLNDFLKREKSEPANAREEDEFKIFP